MCDDDFDVEDVAFGFGFVETQLEGEQEEKDPGVPSPEDLLKEDNPILKDLEKD